MWLQHKHLGWKRKLNESALSHLVLIWFYVFAELKMCH